MEDKEVIESNQLSQFTSSLAAIEVAYSKLVDMRLSDNMSREFYMLYDMMDLFIAFKALADEISRSNGELYPDYLVEKLTTISRYVDTTLEYFKSKN